ncbi:PREDICTED: ethanolamine kinase-like, partial [Rhagoletis zephyria]|uniref:ethanolamine kinase-like n=1 Tax=Rhagoletis zephyria TaxID=28612 RepID=UPI0008114E43
KFTDGITNKLVGCFYNPPLSTTNNNGNDIENGSSNGNNNTPTSPTAPTSTLVDDNNDSGNISDTDTLDSEVTTSSAGEAASPPQATNINTKDENYSNVALVRVYGNKTDLLIDRKAETRNIQLLHTYGFAPTLFATFKNGLVYDFVPGVTLKPTSVLEPNVWRLVATRMAEMHRRVKVKEVATAGGGGGGEGAGAGKPLVPMLWRKVQSFFDLVPERFSDADKQKRYTSSCCPTFLLYTTIKHSGYLNACEINKTLKTKQQPKTNLETHKTLQCALQGIYTKLSGWIYTYTFVLKIAADGIARSDMVLRWWFERMVADWEIVTRT